MKDYEIELMETRDGGPAVVDEFHADRSDYWIAAYERLPRDAKGSRLATLVGDCKTLESALALVSVHAREAEERFVVWLGTSLRQRLQRMEIELV